MPTLKIHGTVTRETGFSLEDFERFNPGDRIEDATRIGFRKGGRAVRFSAILERVKPLREGCWITFCAPEDPFFASIPLHVLMGEGVVIYADSNGSPIPPDHGGYFRFFIPDPAKCGTEARDECLNVKHLQEIVFSETRGKDTRPSRPDPTTAPLASLLRITGSVGTPSEFSPAGFDRFDPPERVEDARSVGFRKGGRAVRLGALLQRTHPGPDGKWITFCAPTDPFFASVPLESLQGEGLIVYTNADGEPLTPEEGGPFRFFIPDFGKCGSEARDACLLVKHLQQIILSPERGRDTRPPVPAGKE